MTQNDFVQFLIFQFLCLFVDVFLKYYIFFIHSGYHNSILISYQKQIKGKKFLV
jgi:hypothetical protein